MFCLLGYIKEVAFLLVQLYVISMLPFFITMEQSFAKDESVDYCLSTLSSIIVLFASVIIIELIQQFTVINILFFGQKLSST